MKITRLAILGLALVEVSFAYTSRSEVARIDDDWILLQGSVDSLVAASGYQRDGRDAVHELVFGELLRRDRMRSGKPVPDTLKLGERVAELVLGAKSPSMASEWDEVQKKIGSKDLITRTLIAEILRDKGAALVPSADAIEAALIGEECAPGAGCGASRKVATKDERTQARASLIAGRIEDALAQRLSELQRGCRLQFVPRLRPGSFPDKGFELAKQIVLLESFHHLEKKSYSRSLKALGAEPVPGCSVRFLSAAKKEFEAEVRCDSSRTVWRIDETGEPFDATGAGKPRTERFGMKVVLKGRLEREERLTFDQKVAPIATLRLDGKLVAKPGGRCRDALTARSLQLRLDASEIARLESLDGSSVTVTGVLDCSRKDIEVVADQAIGEGEDFLPLQLRGAAIVR